MGGIRLTMYIVRVVVQFLFGPVTIIRLPKQPRLFCLNTRKPSYGLFSHSSVTHNAEHSKCRASFSFSKRFHSVVRSRLVPLQYKTPAVQSILLHPFPALYIHSTRVRRRLFLEKLIFLEHTSDPYIYMYVCVCVRALESRERSSFIFFFLKIPFFVLSDDIGSFFENRILDRRHAVSRGIQSSPRVFTTNNEYFASRFLHTGNTSRWKRTGPSVINSS